MFPIAGVPSRSKMYRTSATSDLHSDLHFALKTKVYTVHFAKTIYTLNLELYPLYKILDCDFSIIFVVQTHFLLIFKKILCQIMKQYVYLSFICMWTQRGRNERLSYIVLHFNHICALIRVIRIDNIM